MAVCRPHSVGSSRAHSDEVCGIRQWCSSRRCRTSAAAPRVFAAHEAAATLWWGGGAQCDAVIGSADSLARCAGSGTPAAAAAGPCTGVCVCVRAVCVLTLCSCSHVRCCSFVCVDVEADSNEIFASSLALSLRADLNMFDVCHLNSSCELSCRLVVAMLFRNGGGRGRGHLRGC